MEIINNFNWNLVGGILAALSLLATIIIFLLQKNKKRLSYEITAETTLLTTKEKIEGKFKILYNDQEVQNVSFFELKIINSGNIGIPAADFEKPIKIKFPEISRILSCEIVENNPDSLDATIFFNESEISIEPLLINAKDYFVLKAIISDFEYDDFTINARIKDVKEIRKLDESSQFILWASLGLTLTITGIIRFMLSVRGQEKITMSTANYIDLGLLIGGYAILIFAMTKNKRFVGKMIFVLRRRSRKY